MAKFREPRYQKSGKIGNEDFEYSVASPIFFNFSGKNRVGTLAYKYMSRKDESLEINEKN